MLTTTNPKDLANAQAEAALMGAAVVPIEGDTGRPEFVFTDGPVTLRTGNLAALHQVVADLRKRKEGGQRNGQA